MCHILLNSLSVKVDDQFYNRCIENGGGFIVGGDNYGQGSSREHAALVPNYLKIKDNFCLFHLQEFIVRTLINNGILPLVINQKDYDFFNDQDEYELINLLDSVESNKDITVINKTNNQTITAN